MGAWHAQRSFALVIFTWSCATGCADDSRPPLPKLGQGGQCTGDDCKAPCGDADEDGAADIECGGTDCDDSDASVHPDASEISCNGVDDDCSELTADVPGDSEVTCNGVDDDCDASTPDRPDVDLDVDGFDFCDDCDDLEFYTHPGADEICGDLVDQDCDGQDTACPACGDGALDDGEVCDDGNAVGGDGCRADCRGEEVCGDGLADLAAGEDCDGPQDGACLGACSSNCACPDPPGAWTFVDVTVAAGIDAPHSYDASSVVALGGEMWMAGGVAAGDYDGDGWVDLYTVGGELEQNHLWHNQGDGTFVDVALMAGVALPFTRGSGPVFADFTGDGALDLFVGGVVFEPPRLFENQLDGTFAELSTTAEFTKAKNHVGAAFADVDGDGDLDAFVAHWGSPPPIDHLFRNDGGGAMVGVSSQAGLDSLQNNGLATSFTPNFVDINHDGFIDLLVAQDFGFSRYYLGNGDGTFTDATNPVISDQNGMGAAIGDFDNDGDVDWLVTSIFDPDGVSEGFWGITGNRLYENLADGTFADATETSGLAVGYWGWGACMADFNLDGHLDVFHVNGYQLDEAKDFFADPAVLYLANGDGTFTERALELGIDATGQGRGVSCLDFDRDGDIDIFVANNQGLPRLYANNGVATGNYLRVALAGPLPNAEGIGSRIVLTAGTMTQAHAVRAGSNFVSQDPAAAHFGLGLAGSADVTVHWAHGPVTTVTDVAANQEIVVAPP